MKKEIKKMPKSKKTTAEIQAKVNALQEELDRQAKNEIVLGNGVKMLGTYEDIYCLSSGDVYKKHVELSKPTKREYVLDEGGQCGKSVYIKGMKLWDTDEEIAKNEKKGIQYTEIGKYDFRYKIVPNESQA